MFGLLRDFGTAGNTNFVDDDDEVLASALIAPDRFFFFFFLFCAHDWMVTTSSSDMRNHGSDGTYTKQPVDRLVFMTFSSYRKFRSSNTFGDACSL